MNHLRIILENTCYLRSNIKVLRAINKLNCYEPAYAQKSNGLPGLGNVCPAPHSQNVITQAISGKIIKDAVRRAILDTIGPVVARAAYTAVAITANTVYKDLAWGIEVNHVRKPTYQMARQLAASLASAYGEVPLRKRMTDYIRMVQAELQAEFPDLSIPIALS